MHAPLLSLQGYLALLLLPDAPGSMEALFTLLMTVNTNITAACRLCER